MTPTSIELCAEKTAPLTLILNIDVNGGDQETMSDIDGLWPEIAATLYSSKYYGAHCTKAIPLFFIPPCLTSFWLNYFIKFVLII